MKKTFSRLIIMEAFLLIAAMLLLFVNVLLYHGRQIDVVAINDYVQTAKEHWEDGDFEKTALAKLQVMILGADGTVLYQTEDKAFQGITSQSSAIQKGMYCISVTEGDHMLGTLVIPNPAREDFELFMRSLLWVTGLIVIMIVLTQVAFLWYVRRNVVRPFERMKEFASQVAQGNFDEPLRIEKDNMFGLFTESFDMMREELRASKNREIALKKKEKELVASLSHDLKSPVAGIQVICELLEVKVEDAYLSTGGNGGKDANGRDSIAPGERAVISMSFGYGDIARIETKDEAFLHEDLAVYTKHRGRILMRVNRQAADKLRAMSD